MSDKKRSTLEQVLASVSESLFPAEMGRAIVSVDTTDCMGDTALHVLVRRGDRFGVQLLLRHGADPNAVGDMGETPLHVAASGGDAQIIRALIESGATPGFRSEFGVTANDLYKGGDKHTAKLLKGGG
ncbi:MAG: ankyrin repeat domain-containing protein [Pseudomonadota bacterium]